MSVHMMMDHRQRTLCEIHLDDLTVGTSTLLRVRVTCRTCLGALPPPDLRDRESLEDWLALP